MRGRREGATQRTPTAGAVAVLAGLALGARGFALAGGLLVLAGLLRAHLRLAPAADLRLTRPDGGLARAASIFSLGLIGALGTMFLVPAWLAVRVLRVDLLGREGSARWRPLVGPREEPAPGGRASAPSLPRLAFKLGLVVVVLMVAGVVWNQTVNPSSTVPATPAALAQQPGVITMQAEEGAIFEALQADPDLGWRLPSEAQGSEVSVEDSHRGAPMASGTGPVVWLYGGSATWGSGQRDDHTIAANLERMAAAEGVPIQIVNRGVFAYGSAQEATAFRHQVAAEGPPDLVIFYDGYNDVEVSMATQLQGLAPGSQAMAPLDVLERDPVLERAPGETASSTRERVAGVIESYRRSMAEARSTASANEVAMVQAWQPNVFTRTPTQAERADLASLGYDEFLFDAHRRLHRQVRAELPDEVVDLSDVLDNAPTVYIDQVHTNETGAEAVATALLRQIEPAIAEMTKQR